MYKKVVDFSKFSSIKIGSKITVSIIENGDSIKLPENGFIVGGANNLLISPTPPPLFMLSKDFNYIKDQDNFLEVGAKVMSGQLLSYAKKYNISGFEFMAKLPGTVGGMVAMNAGVKEYEIFNLIEEIKINNSWISKDKIEYGYRFAKISGVITTVKLKKSFGYSRDLEKRLIKLRVNQPKEPSAGSTFKNPEGDFAGRLIEAVGLKGKRVGDVAFSKIHSNFLVNFGSGTFQDAIFLINEAKKRVLKEFNIYLEEEIKIV